MSSGSNIEWTDSTWNPVVGCTKVSEGCRNCYAMVMAQRVAAAGERKSEEARERGSEEGTAGARKGAKSRAYRAVVKRDGKDRPLPQWNNVVVTVEEALTEPLKWRKPRRVFVNSMSDLFHEDVPFEFIDKVFAVMALCPQHTFQVLTKRPGRMVEYLLTGGKVGNRYNERATLVGLAAMGMVFEAHGADRNSRLGSGMLLHKEGEPVLWPLPNVWLGVSVEDQAAADARIPLLLRVPAAVRFLSVEPMLGAVDLRMESITRIQRTRGVGYTEASRIAEASRPQWVIVGGESGPGARPCDVAWVRGIVQQCRASGVACFVKQLGAHVLCANDRVEDWLEEVGGELGYFDLPSEAQVYQGMPLRMRLADRKGGDMAEWPEDLRVREFPKGGA